MSGAVDQTCTCLATFPRHLSTTACSTPMLSVCTRAVLGLNGFPLDEMNLGALVSMLVTKAFVFQFEFVGL